jgi:TRAP-type C4-dicarboxylate transport system substrate-binding protein
MKQNLFGVIATLAAVAVFSAMVTPCAGLSEPIKLSYANFPPAPTFPCVQMERWKTEVEKRTDGKVRVNTFPGGTLLGAKEMMDGVIQGQADIGCLCMAYQPGRFMITNASSLPLGIPNARVGSQVLWDLYRQYKPSSFAQVKVLAMFTTAPSNIMSKVAIRSLEDIKGVDLRASGGAAQILAAWGANQVGMPMSATPEALQKGVVKGLFSSLEVMKDFKFAETCKYVTVTDTVIYPFAVVMNMKAWDRLPQDVKAVFEALAPEQSLWTGTYMDGHVAKANQWSKQNEGVEFITLSAAEKARWNQRLAPITEKWIGAADAAGLPGKKIVADIEALIEKYQQ